MIRIRLELAVISRLVEMCSHAIERQRADEAVRLSAFRLLSALLGNAGDAAAFRRRSGTVTTGVRVGAGRDRQHRRAGLLRAFGLRDYRGDRLRLSPPGGRVSMQPAAADRAALR